MDKNGACTNQLWAKEEGYKLHVMFDEYDSGIDHSSSLFRLGLKAELCLRTVGPLGPQ